MPKKKSQRKLENTLANKNITYSWNAVKAVLREMYNCKGLNFKKRKNSSK